MHLNIKLHFILFICKGTNLHKFILTDGHTLRFTVHCIINIINVLCIPLCILTFTFLLQIISPLHQLYFVISKFVRILPP